MQGSLFLLWMAVRQVGSWGSVGRADGWATHKQYMYFPFRRCQVCFFLNKICLRNLGIEKNCVCKSIAAEHDPIGNLLGLNKVCLQNCGIGKSCVCKSIAVERGPIGNLLGIHVLLLWIRLGYTQLPFPRLPQATTFFGVRG